ncbi:MAG: prolipoprotein diacylglyceryl transferase [Bacteroidales bacterium]|nr:prolipoprotein diacylglyceryl transferase [Bacteroidales bacterium]MCF8350949.1 prolipoprotein diacylglyceryl transferase [Bacteroidales bacterium]MCF8376552.1 prolipoprotein diacylglyceryl transferase [Bacteroidales bacterium]MCF8400596.1 prolipoprotein diacylglyceryl transferase [Bacteroidales bacterium]
MYPRLNHFFYDVFGWKVNLPIQSYGFFVALAFLIAGYLLYLELKRKENTGLLRPQKKKVIKGEGPKAGSLITTFLIMFVIGFKLAGLIMDYPAFADNPQDYIFSLEGNLIGGIIIGLGSGLYQYYLKRRSKLPEPVEETELVHPYQLTGNMVLLAAVAGIIGAKIFHQLENWNEFIADPWEALFSFSGLTFYGGLIVAAFVLVYYAEKNDISWKRLADSVAPSLMIAYGIGRIGCHVSGDGDWGIVNTAAKPGWLSWLPDWLWSYDYPHNVLQRGVEISGCDPAVWGSYCNKLAQPVFPTPIYETVVSLLFFAFLWSLRKKLKAPGMLFAIYLILNGVERFFIEKIRVNTEYLIFGARITQAEIISTVLIILGILGIWYFNKTHKRRNLQKT